MYTHIVFFILLLPLSNLRNSILLETGNCPVNLYNMAVRMPMPDTLASVLVSEVVKVRAS